VCEYRYSVPEVETEPPAASPLPNLAMGRDTLVPRQA